MITYGDYVLPALAVITTAVGVGAFGWYKILKETNVLLTTQNAELKLANKELLSQHHESSKTMSLMQGQIDILKSIPLGSIDETLREISKVNKGLAESNKNILDTLRESAMILASNTAAASSAVRDVKSDLRAQQA